MRRSSFFLTAVWVLAACSNEPTPLDAGLPPPADSGVETRPLDADFMDAMTPDTGGGLDAEAAPDAEPPRDGGVTMHAEPADAPWGERYFHVRDPDGHELSFARPLAQA